MPSRIPVCPGCTIVESKLNFYVELEKIKKYFFLTENMKIEMVFKKLKNI